MTTAFKDFEAQVEFTPECDPLSELANAHRLVKKYGKRLRHSPSLGWLYYDGTRWAPGEKMVRRWAAKVGGMLRAESGQIKNDDVAKAYRSAGRRAESSRGIESTMKIAAVLEPIDATNIEFDAHPWLLNCSNCEVDLQTGKELKHDPEHYHTKICKTAYKPGAKRKDWIDHLMVVFGDDKTMVDYFQFLAGYALTASMKHQLFVIVHGKGGRGKSTTVEALARVIGDDYGTAISHDVVLDTRNTGHACTTAALRGVRFGLLAELPPGARWNEAAIKRLSAGNSITARYIGCNPFTFQSTVKMFADCNERPEFRDQSGGMERRIRCVPFEVQLSDTDQCNRNIDAELDAEAEGILAWAVEGAVIAHDREPTVPERVRLSSAEYARENDALAEFLATCCVVDAQAQATKSAAFEAYQNWGGPLKKRQFGKLLETRFDEYSDGKSRYWIGFRLTS